MKIVKRYKISLRTMALVEQYHHDYNTIIYDEDGVYYSKQTVRSILEDACMRGFSTYEGRTKVARKLLNYIQKTPLLICLNKNICAFPTMSPNNYGCIWIIHHQVQNCQMKDRKLTVTFNNGTQLPLDCSLRVFKQQQERTSNCINYYYRNLLT
ncbi:hypothetical protein F9802_06570 [Bacillus aerolatus]|uniref:Competence protein n=1 Tax=Bacillus aerolatus TaxID=2653354 RepID=A0A6I1FMB5_9BACI|nr:competence protein ComK [Bacillus aerolatus]KAB7707411.1 hypothetical protein F9802_06570 [Bacillus aerolatus]